MRFSYSKVECFETCPYKYKLRYVDKIKCFDENDPQSPLILGTAIHKAIETDVETAIKEYYNSYPIITDIHINEALKIKYLIPIIKDEILPSGLHEVKFEADYIIGFIDLLVPNEDGTYDIYDFKYSNNVDNYLKKGQLHVYKFYAEHILNIKVRNLYYLFIPKVMIRQKKTETLIEFRKRLLEELSKQVGKVVKVDYNANKVQDFQNSMWEIETAVSFPKKEQFLCDYCEYKDLCKDGKLLNYYKEEEIMLPSTNRVEVTKDNFKKLWLYGAPFSGKTTLADEAETPLNLNTDGNVKYVSMARLPIKDEVITSGRISKRKFAWEIFKEAVDELEKGSEFKTVVVDLLEDTYDFARVFMCDKNGWEHESDDSFKAYDIVRSEFLRTIKRLLNLPYNIILISHEDSSRDIMKKGNDKITKIAPNLAEKLANKVAGMVDLVARVVVEDDGTRTLNFKSNEVVFGGGRLQGINVDKCALNWKSLCEVYESAIGKVAPMVEPKINPEPVEPAPVKTEEVKVGKPVEEEPVKTERPRRAKVEEVFEEPTQEDPFEEAKPVRRTRRVRE